MEKFFKRLPWRIVLCFAIMALCFIADEIWNMPWLVLVALVPSVVLLIWFTFVAARDSKDG